MDRPSKEMSEYIKELVDYDYNMGNSLFHVKLNRAEYLHDEERKMKLKRLHFMFRKWAKDL